jgi:trk system potassium uptake protein TrkH
MTEQTTALRYAVRLPVVGKYFGQLCLVLAAVNGVPLAAALWLGSYEMAARYAVAVGGLAAVGWSLGRSRVRGTVQVNEGMVVVAAIFLMSALVAACMLRGLGLSFADAWFEAVSGVTTTNMTVLRSLEEMPAVFGVSRTWMQWYAGLGIMIFSLALVVQPGLVNKRLAGGQVHADDLVGGTKAHARRVLTVYAVLTAVGVAVLLVMGAGPLHAVLFATGAVSTAGFAPHEAGLSALGWHVQAVVTVLCIVGATPFAVYWRSFREKGLTHVEGLQLAGLLGSGLVVMMLLGLCWWAQGARGLDIVRNAPLLAFAAQTTAGYTTFGVAESDAGSKVVLIVSMLMGGGVGSTAGGFKVVRMLVVLRMVQVLLRRACLPRHAVAPARLAGHRLEDAEVQEAMLLILLFVGLIVVSWLPFVVMGYDPLDALFEVVAATSTAGLSVGITGPELPTALKTVLTVDMLLGRLEIIAWLVLLNPATWVGKRVKML